MPTHILNSFYLSLLPLSLLATHTHTPSPCLRLVSCKVTELVDLEEEDIDELGLKKLEKRRLVRAVEKVKASASGALPVDDDDDEEEDDADAEAKLLAKAVEMSKQGSSSSSSSSPSSSSQAEGTAAAGAAGGAEVSEGKGDDAGDDAGGGLGLAVRCIWKEQVKQAEQRKIMEQILDLVYMYGNMFQDVEDPTKPFDAERAAVAACAYAIFDAVVRTPASDGILSLTQLLSEDGGYVIK